MAKNKTAPETQNSIDALNERLTGMGSKLETHKKIVIAVVALIIVIVIGIFSYIYLVRNPRKKKEQQTTGMGMTAQLLGNDSIAKLNYNEAIDKYDSKISKIMLATIYTNEGKYEESNSLLDDVKAPEDLTAAAILSLKGDNYLELGRFDDAISAYKDAIDESDNNPYYTPFFMLKLARAYHIKGAYSAEASTYQDIKDQYPDYAAQTGIDLNKYIARAKALAAN